jgi:hypothetical protein
VPGLSDELAAAALSDLAGGRDLAIGPSGDGSMFFVAIAHRDPRLVALIGQPFPGVAVTAGALGFTVGMLRSERRLVTPADAFALLADPLAPPELTALLAPLR